MIKKYVLKDVPQIEKVISIESLKDISPSGFLIFKIGTLNPDEIADIQESLDEICEELKIRCVIITSDVSVHEVIQVIEEDENNEGKNSNRT